MSEFRNIFVGNTITVTVDFLGYNPTTDDDEPSPPSSVSVIVKNSSGATIASGTPTASSSYSYFYNYTPTLAGEFDIIFNATFPDTTTLEASQKIYVSDYDETYQPTATLLSDSEVVFASLISPLYLDPEELLSIFPDASLLEIAEIINRYSSEIKEIAGLTDDDDGSSLSHTLMEYIKAATACDLSRTYSFGSDDEVMLKLADFSVTTNSAPRDKLNRGNATTWCQIAAVLRNEILALKVSPKSFQIKSLPFYSDPRLSPSKKDVITSGQNHLEDPMPSRRLIDD